MQVHRLTIHAGEAVVKAVGWSIIAVLSATSIACSNEPFRPETTPRPGVSIEYLTPYTPIAGKRFSSGVVVWVRDDAGNGRFRIPVQFQPAAHSGIVSASNVLTDQFGKAHVEWTLDPIVGVNTLNITVENEHRVLTVTSIAGADTVSRTQP
jgi:hypothetical protein